jgi:predicted RNA-binding Zn ribbon-like protein
MTAEVQSEEAESRPAPEPLKHVQLLINSDDRMAGVDHLAEPDGAHRWLGTQDLLPPAAVLRDNDLELVRGVREALRAMVVHNAGGPAPTAAELAPLEVVTAATRAAVTVTEDQRVCLAPAEDTLAGRLLQLLLVVRDAQLAGTWTRLKGCGNPDCRWAFYDRSRNSGGTWCSMQTCGNRLKNRDFRARHRPQQ